MYELFLWTNHLCVLSAPLDLTIFVHKSQLIPNKSMQDMYNVSTFAYKTLEEHPGFSF